MSNSVSNDPVSETEAVATDSRSANSVRDRSTIAALLLWFLIGLFLPLLGISPLLFAQARRLIEHQEFWYFPISIAIGVWLLFWTCSYRQPSKNRGRVSVVLLWIGLACSVFGIYWYSSWVIHVASVVIILAWSLGACGGTSWTRLTAICSLFLATVPLPGGRDVQFSHWLASIASWFCNGLLDAISIPNIVEGDRIQIAVSKFRITDVCAGVDSVFAFIAIGIAVVAIRRCAFLPGLITLLVVPLFSVLENVLRLLVIAMGLFYFKADLADGWAHFVVAVVVFIVSVLSFWLTHQTIVAVLEPIDVETAKSRVIDFYQLVTRWPADRGEQETTDAEDVEIPTWKPSMVSLMGPFAISLILVAVSAYASMTISDSGPLMARMSEEKAASLPSDEAFPEQFGGLKKVGFRSITQPGNSPSGKYSHLWRFDDQGNQVFASLDFPFQGWQPVWSFYQLSGWKIIDVKPVEVPKDFGQSWLVEEFKMQNQYGLYGFVWYAFFDENGVPVDRKLDTEQLSRKSIFERLQNKEVPIAQLTYQVQVFFESGKELSEAETERNRKLFFAIYEQVRQQSKSVLMKAQ